MKKQSNVTHLKKKKTSEEKHEKVLSAWDAVYDTHIEKIKAEQHRAKEQDTETRRKRDEDISGLRSRLDAFIDGKPVKDMSGLEKNILDRVSMMQSKTAGKIAELLGSVFSLSPESTRMLELHIHKMNPPDIALKPFTVDGNNYLITPVMLYTSGDFDLEYMGQLLGLAVECERVKNGKTPNKNTDEMKYSGRDKIRVNPEKIDDLYEALHLFSSDAKRKKIELPEGFNIDFFFGNEPLTNEQIQNHEGKKINVRVSNYIQFIGFLCFLRDEYETDIISEELTIKRRLAEKYFLIMGNAVNTETLGKTMQRIKTDATYQDRMNDIADDFRKLSDPEEDFCDISEFDE